MPLPRRRAITEDPDSTQRNRKREERVGDGTRARMKSHWKTTVFNCYGGEIWHAPASSQGQDLDPEADVVDPFTCIAWWHSDAVNFVWEPERWLHMFHLLLDLYLARVPDVVRWFSQPWAAVSASQSGNRVRSVSALVWLHPYGALARAQTRHLQSSRAVCAGRGTNQLAPARLAHCQAPAGLGVAVS